MVDISGPLTPRQAQALRAIATHIDKHGWPPTQRELGERIGAKSTNQVSEFLCALERKGFIEWLRRKWCGIKLTARGRSAVRRSRSARKRYSSAICKS